ncbi:MAG: hypothetical protein UT28_C0001G0278 [Berkelbacteria bacterium GW2011_GWE1_39_12]|uniref:Uncharacterized protein n=1 Tax=Berkelbacteria bacterium GW2011_GWE1_39_12 TaxID=1618337 RepID=A0A0G4B2J3_9BACT|nr:MAG: hypothetical protein UT28_C0001G0278 [Berkelbacteria bacterium GW2011_GWE1_39_12]
MRTCMGELVSSPFLVQEFLTLFAAVWHENFEEKFVEICKANYN